MAGSFNCSYAPEETATDAGVAGAGILLSFIITAGLSLILSLVIVLNEFCRKSEVKVLRKLLLSLSDQQLLTGISIQSVAIAKMHTMVPYHFFIVWMLSLLSTTTHVGTLIALFNDFRRDCVLRWLRQFLMFVNLSLSIVLGVFILFSVKRDVKPTLPIFCALKVHSAGMPGNARISIVGTVIVMASQFFFFLVGVWYLHVKNRPWLRTVQLVGLVVLGAIGTGAAVRVIILSQAFGKPSVHLSDTAERDWSFGQLLPLLLLLLPLMSAIELLRGEMEIPSPIIDNNVMPLLPEEKQLETTAELREKPPIWASQTSRFSAWD